MKTGQPDAEGAEVTQKAQKEPEKGFGCPFASFA
jgi:hypothetical protein